MLAWAMDGWLTMCLAAERVLYIPSAGLCVGAVLLAGRMRVPRVAKHAVFGLILALAVQRCVCVGVGCLK